MEKLKISEIIKAAKGQLLTPSSDSEVYISKIITDSRTACEDGIFIPLKGENFDGHNFIQEIAYKGGKGSLIERNYSLKNIQSNFILIEVENTLTALGNIARYYREKFDIPVIGITGSCGKTTSKEMINNILSKKFKTVCSKENFNNEVGVPLTLFDISVETELCILEMAMRGLGEIKNLAIIGQPNYGAITNVELTHIGRLGSEENIAKAKKELLENLKGKKIAFLNSDNRWTEFLAKDFSGEIIYFGINNKSGIWADKIVQNELSQRFNAYVHGEVVDINLHLKGMFNIYNALLAIAVGWEFGVEMLEIKDALENFSPPKNRLNIFKINKRLTIISDIYNSNPTSLRGALEVLKSGSMSEKGRKVAILGSMLELGDYSEIEHKNIGRIVPSNYADILIAFGSEAKWFADGALEKGMKAESVFYFDNFGEMGKNILEILHEGDVVLIKGSRGMKMERIVELISGDYQ